jgi:uncharacterized protein
MRLTSTEIQNIKLVAEGVFGKQVSVFLFGSRTDDTKKGGDIDLFINYKEDQKGLTQYERKIAFLVALKKRIGEQHIDLIIRDSNHQDAISEEILQNAIKL